MYNLTKYMSLDKIKYVVFNCSTILERNWVSLPNKVWETYCFRSVSYYYYYYYYYSYYITPTVVLGFFFTIIILLIILPHIFVRSISRRCLDQTLWNLVVISYAMWSWSFKGWFFQNGCHCHGNGQNAKKLKNTKMIISGYSPNRN